MWWPKYVRFDIININIALILENMGVRPHNQICEWHG